MNVLRLWRDDNGNELLIPDGHEPPCGGTTFKLVEPSDMAAHLSLDANLCNMADMVNHPTHYTSHPSGVECIEVTEHMNFCTGNAMKYLWRAGLKNDAVEDLKKAVWYINREIERREKERAGQS